MSNFDIIELDQYPEKVFNRLVENNLESKGVFFRSWELYSAGDSTFKKEGRNIKLAVYDRDSIIGLSCGRALSKNCFVMDISLVEKSYRKQGIYTGLLIKMLTLTKEFDEVISYHHIFNNPIIVAKLKQGFRIIGVDHTTIIGPRLKLVYYHNTELSELMEFRMGLREKPV